MPANQPSPSRAWRGLPAAAAAMLMLSAAPAQAAATTAAANEPPGLDTSAPLRALAQHDGLVTDEARTVPACAWSVLAHLANGSTMRSGPGRDAIKRQVLWLRTTQDELGRFAPNGAPCAVFDQTIAAWAMVSAWGLSNYKLLEANAARAVAAVEQAMLAPDGPPTGAELGAVLALLGEQYAFFGRTEPARRITALARQALAGQAFGKTRRGDAALHLAQMVLGETFLPELTVARTWPGDLTADPLQTLFAVQAV
ncbi:MAG TPA: hypothetical protein VFZ65_13860, partial [Planctomycetota bacterium]|nr:hypothetical protein [Planctomycetota bacterium]